MFFRVFKNSFQILIIAMAVTFWFIAGIFSIPQYGNAAPNFEINYQGKLTDTTGLAVPDGTYNMRFWLLTSDSIATTSAVWTESLTTTNRVTVENGLFSVMLGSTSPLTSVNFNQTLYLGVEIGSTTTSPLWDGEMSPRKILGAVPASFEAENANTLDDLNSTQFLRSDTPTSLSSSSVTTLFTITQSGAGDILNILDGATEVFTILDGGKVGIGSSSPSRTLTVAGDSYFGGNVRASTFTATSTSATSTLPWLTSTNLAVTGKFYAAGSPGTNGMVLKSTATGVQWIATTSLGITSSLFTDSGATTYLTAVTDRLAIGTTTASGVLTVSTSTTQTAFTARQYSTGDLMNLFDGATEVASFIDGGLFGLGTTTPTAKFAISGTSGQTSPLFRISSSTNQILMEVLSEGSFNVGQGAIYYDVATNETSIERLNLGNVEFDEDAGAVSWVDMSATATPSNTILSYTAQLDANPVLTVFGQSNGSGSVKNLRVGIGSTTPYGRLTITAAANDTAPLLNIASSTATNRSFLNLSYRGLLGIGSTSPAHKLSVAGSGLFGNFVKSSYFTATSTSATSTLPWLTSTNLAVTGKFYAAGSPGTNGMVLKSTATGVQWIATSSLGISGGSGTLADLTDVDVSGVASGTLLSYNGTDWIDRATSTLGIVLSDTRGTLAATRGGTGLSTITQNQLLIGGAGNTITQVATGSLGLRESLFTDSGATTYLTAVTDRLAIGTTTASGVLTVSTSTTQTAFTARQYSTGDLMNLFDGATEVFTVLDGGKVGIGSTSPAHKLSVAGSGLFGDQVKASYFTATSTATSTFGGAISAASGDLVVTAAGTTNDLLLNPYGGNVGVGTTTPSRRFSVQNAAAAAQFRIAYDNSRYADFQVNATGDLIVDAESSDIYMNDNNLMVCSGGACPTITNSFQGGYAGTGNLRVEKAVYIGQFVITPTTGTTTALSIANASGTEVLRIDGQ